MKVTVIDYGMGNLFSVCRAIEHCDAEPVLCSDPDEIPRAERLVLPGVGAFGDGMAELERRELRGAIRVAAWEGKPLLGICLGMQMMMDSSEEFGLHVGLGLIPGSVTAIPAETPAGDPLKVPHVGWNALVQTHALGGWNGTLLEGTPPSSAVYFVHSYAAVPDHDEHRLANCNYGGHVVCAAVARSNVVGCQFHPEKSGPVGLAILRRFIHGV